MNGFPDTQPAALAPFDASLVPALRQDSASVLHQLGVRSVRAAVVDLPSRLFHEGWAMSDLAGAGALAHAALPTDQVTGSGATIRQLEDAHDDALVFQRRSPHHWTFGWRIDATRAVVAEAHYHDARFMMCEIDTALMRLVCDVGLIGVLALSDSARTRGDALSLSAQRPVDRPERRRQWPSVVRPLTPTPLQARGVGAERASAPRRAGFSGLWDVATWVRSWRAIRARRNGH